MDLTVKEADKGEFRYGRIGKIGAGKKAGTICVIGVSGEWREILALGWDSCLGIEIIGNGRLKYKEGSTEKEKLFDELHIDMENGGYVLFVGYKGIQTRIGLSKRGHDVRWIALPV